MPEPVRAPRRHPTVCRIRQLESHCKYLGGSGVWPLFVGKNQTHLLSSSSSSSSSFSIRASTSIRFDDEDDDEDEDDSLSD